MRREPIEITIHAPNYKPIKKYNLDYNLKVLRHNSGRTQQQMADFLCVSRQALSHWESDYSRPSIDQIIMIGELFDVCPGRLIKYKMEYL